MLRFGLSQTGASPGRTAARQGARVEREGQFSGSGPGESPAGTARPVDVTPPSQPGRVRAACEWRLRNEKKRAVTRNRRYAAQSAGEPRPTRGLALNWVSMMLPPALRSINDGHGTTRSEYNKPASPVKGVRQPWRLPHASDRLASYCAAPTGANSGARISAMSASGIVTVCGPAA